MKISKLVRARTTLVGGAVFFAAVSASASAVPPTFTVSTTIAASCSMTAAAPGNLTPTYSMAADSGVGSQTPLSTFCTGTNPSATFTDAYGSGTNVFAMSNGSSNLYYQISNNATCSGGIGDDPIDENAAVSLGSGASTFNICAAVLTDGQNAGVPAGTYSDTVTYSMTP